MKASALGATIVSLAAALSGCATQYGPMGFMGGVQATPLTADTEMIDARGNGFTDASRVQQFVLLKASQDCLTRGFAKFVITADKDTSRTGTIELPGESYSNSTVNGFGNMATINTTTYSTPGSVIPFVKPGSVVMVKFFKADDPRSADALDAQQIAGNLAPILDPAVAAAAVDGAPPMGAPVGNPHVIANKVELTFADGSAAYKKADYQTALSAWKPLAEQGNGMAENGLGVLYEYGYGGTQDSHAAEQWLSKALAQGSVQAGDNLGWMYEQGLGVKKDGVRAYMWYSLAGDAAGGAEDAKTPAGNLERISATLSQSEIARAKALAAACQKSGFVSCG